MSASLDTGASAARNLPRGAPTALSADPNDTNLAYILRYFDRVMEGHMRIESELFPDLRHRAGGRSLEIEALLAALLIEHSRIGAIWEDELRPAILAALDQKNGRRGGRRLDTVRFKEFIGIFRAHVDREERELLPFVRDLLGRDYASFCGPPDF